MVVGRPLSTRAANRRSKARPRVKLASTWLPSRASWKAVILASARAREAKARKQSRSARVARINRASLAPRQAYPVLAARLIAAVAAIAGVPGFAEPRETREPFEPGTSSEPWAAAATEVA